MKTLLIALISTLSLAAHCQPAFEFSRNIYRSPYANGTVYGVSQDDITHSPLGAFDLRASGTDDCNTHQVVAAAAGTVQFVEDDYNVSGPGLSASNNYVWISHANGEWTKYTHFKQNSVAVAVGQVVNAGTYLGLECSIGAVSPAGFRHLHFEVRRPPAIPAIPNMDLTGGFMDSNVQRLIPVICDIPNNYYTQGESYTAANCACSEANQSFVLKTVDAAEKEASLVTTAITAGGIVTFNNGSIGFFRAGNNITFTPGFTANSGTYFHASLGGCNN
jgi:murein DD-endopeptidase MepM/ murein hydrolase activator NlpD